MFKQPVFKVNVDFSLLRYFLFCAFLATFNNSLVLAQSLAVLDSPQSKYGYKQNLAASSPGAVTEVQLTSPTSQTSAPFTFGLGFKKGDLTDNPTLNINNSQVIVKRRWNDGSVKHAIASGEVALSANTPFTIIVSNSISASGGSNLSAANIQAANPQASVSLGSYGTVNLSNLLSSPVRTWITGPEMVEAHYHGSVGSDLNLSVWFYVRLYKNGNVWIRTSVENGYLDLSPANKTYSASVTIGGKTTYSNSSITHYAHTRWTSEGWTGTDPQITPKHDTKYLKDSHLVPNYMDLAPSTNALNQLYQNYAPNQHGNWTTRMGETGYQEQIGILPRWDALYITSGADPRAYKSVLANAKALNSYGIIWPDSNSRLPVRPSDRATWSYYGNNQGGGDPKPNGNPLNWEYSHHGSGGYLAYLITGDYYYLATMEYNASACYLYGNTNWGSGTSRIFYSQTRGSGWCTRTAGQLVGIGPSTDLIVSDYSTLLAKQASHWNAIVQNLLGINSQLGYIYEYNINNYGSTGVVAPWQDHFFIQSYGHVRDLEPLSSMSTWNTITDYLYRAPVGILGPGGANSYCFTEASKYTFKVSDINSNNPTNWYTSWGTVGLNNYGTIKCGNTLNGGSGGAPSSASTGYWGNLIPAIAYAVDHGAPGASTAWARLTNATNWSTVLGSGFNDTPQWGIVPRTPTNTSKPKPPINLRQIIIPK